VLESAHLGRESARPSVPRCTSVTDGSRQWPIPTGLLFTGSGGQPEPELVRKFRSVLRSESAEFIVMLRSARAHVNGEHGVVNAALKSVPPCRWRVIWENRPNKQNRTPTKIGKGPNPTFRLRTGSANRGREEAPTALVAKPGEAAGVVRDARAQQGRRSPRSRIRRVFVPTCPPRQICR
jgi:hypothetical protein